MTATAGMIGLSGPGLDTVKTTPRPARTMIHTDGCSICAASRFAAVHLGPGDGELAELAAAGRRPHRLQLGPLCGAVPSGLYRARWHTCTGTGGAR